MDSSLKSGNIKTCGCGRTRNILGKRFGKLLVVEKAKPILLKSGKHATAWKCLCDCGQEVIVKTNSLIEGHTKSCGCYHDELFKNAVTKHNLSRTRIYRIWAGLFQRCKNKNNPSYKDYGGRGICICEEWNDFENFVEWARQNGYEKKLTLDRIDVNGNYCPTNCRWATPKEQSNNRRDNHFMEYNGKKYTLTEFARENQIDPSVFSYRYRAGWSIEEAINTPIGGKRAY